MGKKERVIMRTEEEEYQDLLKMAKMICSVQGGSPEKVAQDIMKKRKREREQGEEFPNKS